MKVIGTGFLSKEGIDQAQQLQKDLAQILRLTERAIELCHSGMAGVSVPRQVTPEEHQRVIACVVMARLLEISEAIILLARGGFSVEVESNFRNFLEAFFIFGNVCKDPDFVPQYFSTDLTVRQKIINQAMKHAGAPFISTKEYATDEVRAQLKEQIAEVAATEMNTYQYAKNVEAAHLYDSMYRITSSASHSAPRSLSGYTTEAPTGEILEVRRHPQMGNIPTYVRDVGTFLLNVCEAFSDLFCLDAHEAITQLRAEFQSTELMIGANSPLAS
jgi:hypothetical protein